jgi:hypothetical protein
VSQPCSEEMTTTACCQRAQEAIRTDRRADHRDYIRGREIVDMVRDELSAIRKEFKLAQRVASWQSESSPNQRCARWCCIGEASIPVSLRTLLVDHISAMDDLAQATEALHAHLIESLGEHWAKLPQRGVFMRSQARRCRQDHDGGPPCPCRC